jgi:hypothetical protein
LLLSDEVNNKLHVCRSCIRRNYEGSIEDMKTKRSRWTQWRHAQEHRAAIQLGH